MNRSDKGRPPDVEDAQWDRLVDRRRRAPTSGGGARPQAEPEPPPAPVPPERDEALHDLARDIAELRAEVEELSRRLDKGDLRVSLDAEQLGHLLKRLLEGMTFDSPVMVRDQKINLRLRLRPTGTAKLDG